MRQALRDPQSASEAFRSALSHDPKLAGDRGLGGRRPQVAGTQPPPGRQAGRGPRGARVCPDGPQSRPGRELAPQPRRVAAARRPGGADAWSWARGFNADHPEAFEPRPTRDRAVPGVPLPGFHDQRASRHAQTFRERGDLRDLVLPDQPLPEPARPDVTHSIRRRARTGLPAPTPPTATCRRSSIT